MRYRYRYMMTCGHNSNNSVKCPYKCPNSISLIDLQEQEKEESIDRVQEILVQIDSLEEQEKVLLLGKLFKEDDQGESE